jgi:hypothetical protein
MTEVYLILKRNYSHLTKKILNGLPPILLQALMVTSNQNKLLENDSIALSNIDVTRSDQVLVSLGKTNIRTKKFSSKYKCLKVSFSTLHCIRKNHYVRQNYGIKLPRQHEKPMQINLFIQTQDKIGKTVKS